MATDMTVANNILQQLGGRTFKAMTGAKNFIGDVNRLTFRLPSNFALQGINYVEVVLELDDTYTVTFGKIWGRNYNIISTHPNIYNDNLRDVFKRTTGLDVSLGSGGPRTRRS